MRTVTVSVTAADIAAGTACSSRCCPVAVAMTRALGKPIVVNGEKWKFDQSVEFKPWRSLPAPVPEIIDQYDERQPMQPFTFEVTI